MKQPHDNDLVRQILPDCIGFTQQFIAQFLGPRASRIHGETRSCMAVSLATAIIEATEQADMEAAKHNATLTARLLPVALAHLQLMAEDRREFRPFYIAKIAHQEAFALEGALKLEPSEIESKTKNYKINLL